MEVLGESFDEPSETVTKKDLLDLQNPQSMLCQEIIRETARHLGALYFVDKEEPGDHLTYNSRSDIYRVRGDKYIYYIYGEAIFLKSHFVSRKPIDPNEPDSGEHERAYPWLYGNEGVLYPQEMVEIRNLCVTHISELVSGQDEKPE